MQPRAMCAGTRHVSASAKAACRGLFWTRQCIKHRAGRLQVQLQVKAHSRATPEQRQGAGQGFSRSACLPGSRPHRCCRPRSHGAPRAAAPAAAAWPWSVPANPDTQLRDNRPMAARLGRVSWLLAVCAGVYRGLVRPAVSATTLAAQLDTPSQAGLQKFTPATKPCTLCHALRRQPCRQKPAAASPIEHGTWGRGWSAGRRPQARVAAAVSALLGRLAGVWGAARCFGGVLGCPCT